MNDRDFFAGCALIGELAAQAVESGFYTEEYFSGLAKRAFQIADAMMRNKQKELWPEISEEELCQSTSG